MAGQQMNHGRRLALVLATALTALLGTFSTNALAHVPLASSARSQPATATYQGAAYLASTTNANISSWSWNGSWQSATLRRGSTAWVYPWSAPWSWVWAGSTWYAVHTQNLVPWHCNQPQFNTNGAITTAATRMYHLNTVGSAVVESLAKGQTLRVSCTNAFLDAASVGSTPTANNTFAYAFDGANSGYVPLSSIDGWDQGGIDGGWRNP
jgi:hypothetical protein